MCVCVRGTRTFIPRNYECDDNVAVVLRRRGGAGIMRMRASREDKERCYSARLTRACTGCGISRRICVACLPSAPARICVVRITSVPIGDPRCRVSPSGFTPQSRAGMISIGALSI